MRRWVVILTEGPRGKGDCILCGNWAARPVACERGESRTSSVDWEIGFVLRGRDGSRTARTGKLGSFCGMGVYGR